MNTDRLNQRASNIELLRIVCMILIVMYHVRDSYYIGIGVLPCAFTFGGIFAVDCFVIITSWYSNGQQNTNHIIKFVGQVLTYIFIYFIAAIIVYSNANGTNIVTSFLIMLRKDLYSPAFNVYWFATSYFWLLLLIPYINPFLNTIDIKKYKSFIITLSILFAIYGSFDYNSSNISNILIFVYIYCLTIYLKRNKNNFFERHYKIGFIGTWALITGSKYLIFHGSIGSTLLGYTSGNTGRYSFILIIFAVFTFYLFLNLKLSYNKHINNLAKLMFGVYLFHENADFNTKNIMIKYIKQYLYPVLPEPILFVLSVASIFILGCFVEYIRQHTVAKPIEHVLLSLVSNIQSSIQHRKIIDKSNH